jgi:hypothetical protein
LLPPNRLVFSCRKRTTEPAKMPAISRAAVGWNGVFGALARLENVSLA